MVDIWSPDSFWLTVTNIALGVVCVALVALVVVAVIGDVRERRRAQARQRLPLRRDDHAFRTLDLGVTMADGGERVDAAKREPTAA